MDGAVLFLVVPSDKGHKLKHRKFHMSMRKKLLYFGGDSAGTGYPERGGGLVDLQSSLPTSTILWCCDSVNSGNSSFLELQ